VVVKACRHLQMPLHGFRSRFSKHFQVHDRPQLAYERLFLPFTFLCAHAIYSLGNLPAFLPPFFTPSWHTFYKCLAFSFHSFVFLPRGAATAASSGRERSRPDLYRSEQLWEMGVG